MFCGLVSQSLKGSHNLEARQATNRTMYKWDLWIDKYSQDLSKVYWMRIINLSVIGGSRDRVTLKCGTRLEHAKRCEKVLKLVDISGSQKEARAPTLAQPYPTLRTKLDRFSAIRHDRHSSVLDSPTRCKCATFLWHEGHWSSLRSEKHLFSKAPKARTQNYSLSSLVCQRCSHYLLAILACDPILRGSGTLLPWFSKPLHYPAWDRVLMGKKLPTMILLLLEKEPD